MLLIISLHTSTGIKMGRVGAILSNFDGTLYPTSNIKYEYNDPKFGIPFLEDILCEISLYLLI